MPSTRPSSCQVLSSKAATSGSILPPKPVQIKIPRGGLPVGLLVRPVEAGREARSQKGALPSFAVSLKLES